MPVPSPAAAAAASAPIFNTTYALQQLLVMAIAGVLALLLLALLRRLLPGRSTAARLGLAQPLGTALLAVLGCACGVSGWGRLLPGPVLPWTVGVALAFYWLAVWWPLAVWLRVRQLRGAAKLALLALATVQPLCALYATFVEPQGLERDTRTLAFAEVGANEIRVAHLTDIQLIAVSRRERLAIDAVNAFVPDIVVISGDYIAKCADQGVGVEAVRWLLRQLDAPGGVYATTGDSDTHEQRLRIFDGLPVHYLRNDSAVVEVKGVRVRIGCLDHETPDPAAMARDARDDELFLVVCHTPDLASLVEREVPTADAYLCGHTHGGQLQIPGVGPVLTFTANTPRRIAAGGVFATETRGMPLLLSRGLGMEGSYAPRFRFCAPPHVFLLRLVAKR